MVEMLKMIQKDLQEEENYKFCPLYLHQISGAVLFAKSLQAVSFTFQNLACFVL
ncbi:hypothetical protein Hanom_Chr14g01330791 [Helianthus anomalus]